jgi:hypothetical protein
MQHPAAAGEVLDVDEQEVVEAVDDEAHTAGSRALDPLVQHRHDAGPVDADVLPRRLRHVEVLPGRVAPAAAVAGKRPVGRAEVGGRHGDGHAELAPLPTQPRRVALDSVALPTGRAVIEQSRAQRSGIDTVPGVVKVPIPAYSTHQA